MGWVRTSEPGQNCPQWRLRILFNALLLCDQVGDAMEMMILSILAPQLHCEWKLPSYQVALITAVGSSQEGVPSPELVSF